MIERAGMYALADARTSVHEVWLHNLTTLIIDAMSVVRGADDAPFHPAIFGRG
jgi:hypothetical protein